MADRKISQLPDHGVLRGGDQVPANRTSNGATTTGRATVDPTVDPRIDNLEQRVADLHVGVQPTGFVDATAADGGLWVTESDVGLAAARAATYVSPTASGVGGKEFVVRLRHGTDPRQARVVFAAGGASYDDAVNGLKFLGSDSTGTAWDYYYEARVVGDAVQNATLQITPSDDHVGTTDYGGTLTGDLADGIVDFDALDDGVKHRLAQILSLQSVTRDLYRGPTSTAASENTSLADGALAQSDQGYVGSGAWRTELAKPGDGWNNNIYVRLKDSADRTNWFLRVFGPGGVHIDFPGGGWIAAASGTGSGQVSNQQDGFTYWYTDLDTLGDGVSKVELWTSEHDTTYTGRLGNGIVTLDALAAAVAERILPALPNAGDRDRKRPIFVGDSLQWLIATPFDPPSIGAVSVTGNTTGQINGAYQRIGVWALIYVVDSARSGRHESYLMRKADLSTSSWISHQIGGQASTIVEIQRAGAGNNHLSVRKSGGGNNDTTTVTIYAL